MNVLVVIVNYRTPALVVDCLRSLAPEAARVPGTHVVVTDNASPDDSVAQLSKAIADNGWSDWCTFLPLPKNGGFAYGNNEAIKHFCPEVSPAEAGPPKMRPEFVWLLNPDTIVLDGALTELVNFLKSHPAAGIAGGRAENRDGTVRRSSFRFHSPLGELESAVKFGPVTKVLQSHVVAPGIPETNEKVGWVSGASMLVRRAVFDQIGLLDDAYFMYFEETDFCLRCVRAGFECWYVPQSRIIHLVGQSSGVT
ncbi:MAG TPA: glycosyltransferase family 2 protein, partial [Tepidisphaeraceae bacterium]